MTSFNLSEIMTKANRLHRTYNMSKSEALTKSWAMAKLKKLEAASFILKCKDHWDDVDRKKADELSRQILDLKNKIYPRVIRTQRVDALGRIRRNVWANMLDKIAAKHGTDCDRYRELSAMLENGYEVNEYESLDENAYGAA